MSKKRFEKNVEYLSRIIPKTALKLPYADCSHVSFCKTRRGEDNLKWEAGGKSFYLHSHVSAQQEAEDWFKSLDLKGVNVLYVYGVGLGYYFDAAKKWLDESVGHYLVFIEDDMAVLHRLLETQRGTEILEHKQVQLHYMERTESSEPMFQWLAWFFVLSQMDFSALRAYEKEKEPLFIQLRSQIMHDSVYHDSIAAEYLRYGKSFYRNFYRNMLYLDESYHGNRLFGEFKKVPAIICGAGPSLDKNIDVLAGLSDRALIFAGGSSLNVLASKGILPHFGAGIDPNPPQYERLISNFGYEVPFFYRNRMYHEAFRAIHGPRLFLNGAGGYDISEWFEEKLGLEGEIIDEGHNVVNFCVEIARNLGCDPIVFVGMDLSYTDMRAYASGVLINASVEEHAIVNQSGLDGAAFYRSDIHGNQVYTLWKWINEAEWIASYAESNPHTRFINATEGGLGFRGIPNHTLVQVRDEHLRAPLDLATRVHGEIQRASMPQVSAAKILDLMKELRESLNRCVELADGLVTEAQVMEEKVKSGKSVVHSLQTGKAALYEEELTEEVAYKRILTLPCQVCNKVLARKMHQIQYDSTLKTDREKNLKRLEVDIQKFKFIKEGAQVNLKVMELAVRDFEELGHGVGDFLKEGVKA